jgi:hypothetical protein
MYVYWILSILPKTDVSKSSVRNDLRRTGAELFDFLVFRKYLVEMTKTNEMNLINLLYKLSLKLNLTILMLSR